MSAIGTIIAGIIAGGVTIYSQNQQNEALGRAERQSWRLYRESMAEERRRERVALAERRRQERRLYEEQMREAKKREATREQERREDIVRSSVRDRYTMGQNLISNFYSQKAALAQPKFGRRR